MKNFSLILVCILSSCFLFKNEEFMQQKVFDDGLIIKLYYATGGATDSDVIWIKKIENNGTINVIGKIEWYTRKDKINIERVDKNHISLHFVNKKDFNGRPILFLIDLNKKIKRNDGSPFNIPE